jgi:nucleotide-binding universal stress UspA family protein
MEKILLATDGSERNEGAVREAIKLTKTTEGKLLALFVVQANTVLMAEGGSELERMEKEAREHLENVRERAASEGVECELLVHEGEQPFRFIIDEAEKQGASTIVMGRRGLTGVERLVMGSVTARVIGHAASKVLVVPCDCEVSLERILLATDGSEHNQPAVAEALRLARRFGGKLTALAAFTSEADRVTAEESVAKVVELAGKDDIEVEALALEGSPASAIANMAEEQGAGLIVMGSHGRTGIARLLMGSVTEAVIGHTGSAVLVVPKGV